VQRDNPQREVEQIAAEPEAVPHVPEVQLPEPEIIYVLKPPVSLHKGTTNGSLLIVNGVFSEIKSSPFMTLLSACTPIVLVCVVVTSKL
jgi:hypothetical protein